MPKVTPHPKLVSLSEQVSNSETLSFGGFIAPSPDGVVRLCEDLTGRQYIDFREEDVVDYTQDEETGLTKLLVNPSPIVTVTTTVQLASRSTGETPDDGGTKKTCVEKRIEECKKDPTSNPDFCDSEEAKNLYGVLCSIFGDPRSDFIIIV